MRTRGGLAGLRRVLAVLAAVTAVLTLGPRPAIGQCMVPTEVGQWVNADANTRSLTRVEIRFVCQDQVLNGQPYPPGPPFYVHVWGKCHPTDCDWGEVGAQQLGLGHIFAFYNQGFAKRYVWAKMSQYRPGQLWVYTWTDFTDPKRPDYGVHNWFKRQ